MIKNVLFDLDGTLLPLDMDEFINTYFGQLAKKLAPHGYEPEKLIKGVWTGTGAMMQNDGSMTNEQRFWQVFAAVMGEQVIADMPLFEDFYANEFNLAKSVCGFNPKSKEVVELCKELGYRVALATSPLFPAIATRSRTSWAGLSVEDFELVTTYENCSTSKPNPNYYLEVCEKCGMKPEECLMVGNDATEDTAAAKVGMKVFLVTDCLLNKNNVDISEYPNGSFDDLIDYINKLNK